MSNFSRSFFTLLPLMFSLLSGCGVLSNQAAQPPASPVSFGQKNALKIGTFRKMCEIPNVPDGRFSYSSALTFSAIDEELHKAISGCNQGFSIQRVEPPKNRNPGSDTAIQQLIEGEIAFAGSIRPLTEAEIRRANKRNQKLKQVPVAIDAVIFYTNSDLLTAGLSVEQVRKIFLGQLRNWKEVGGSDLPIVPYSLDPKATSTIKQILNGSALGSNVKICRDYTVCLRAVGKMPGAISYGAGAIVVNQRTVQTLGLSKGADTNFIFPLKENGKINTPAFQNGSYPMTRRLFIIFRQDGTSAEMAGLAYANFLLSTEGQEIIKKSGLVPILN